MGLTNQQHLQGLGRTPKQLWEKAGQAEKGWQIGGWQMKAPFSNKTW
jgi:hypothetical protein